MSFKILYVTATATEAEATEKNLEVFRSVRRISFWKS